MFHKTGHSRKPWISSWTLSSHLWIWSGVGHFRLCKIIQQSTYPFFSSLSLVPASWSMQQGIFLRHCFPSDYGITPLHASTSREGSASSIQHSLDCSHCLSPMAFIPISQRFFLINSLQLSWSMGQKSSSYCLVLIPPARYCE